VSTTGNTIVFQGADKPRMLKFGGIVNSATFYDELREQLDKWYTLRLTDDQDGSWDIVIKTYTFKRIRRALNQHRFDYEVTAIVL